MLSFEAFDDKKRVTICVDGDLSTKKNFFVDPSWDIIDFVRSAGQRLDVHGLTHCFTFDGRGVSHVDEFNDSDTIVLSANSKWTDAQSLPLARDGDGESSPAAMIDGLPLHVGDYEVGKFLGQGGFGQVRIGTHRSTDEQVALKFAAKKAIRNMKDIMRSNQEFQTLMSLTHSNVIRLMSRVEHAKYVVLAFELMAGGDLHGFLTERGGKGRVVGDVAVTNAEAKLVMRQLLSAVSYAHLNLVVHRDLKLENVFLLRKGSLDKVKIGDFGLCDLFTHQSEKKKFDGWGTMYILPPEVWEDADAIIGPPFDVWALGVILFTLLNGRLPFSKSGYNLAAEDQPEDDVVKARVVAGAYKLAAGVDPLAADLLRWMLKTQPAHRATISEILNHPWFEQDDAETSPVKPAGDAAPAGNDASDVTTIMSGNTSSVEFEAGALLPRLVSDLRGDPLAKSLHAVDRRPVLSSPRGDVLGRSVHSVMDRRSTATPSPSLPPIGRGDSGKADSLGSSVHGRLLGGGDILGSSLHGKKAGGGGTSMLGGGGGGSGGPADADDAWARSVRMAKSSQKSSGDLNMSERASSSSNAASQRLGMPKVHGRKASMLASLDNQIDALSQSLHTAPYARKPAQDMPMPVDPLTMSERGPNTTAGRRKASYMDTTRSSNYKMPESFGK